MSIADVFADLEDYAHRDPWMSEALCAEIDPELWFPPASSSPGRAKAVCQSCQVRAECLSYALENGIEFGVWGGLSEPERQRLSPRSRDLAA